MPPSLEAARLTHVAAQVQALRVREQTPVWAAQGRTLVRLVPAAVQVATVRAVVAVLAVVVLAAVVLAVAALAVVALAVAVLAVAVLAAAVRAVVSAAGLAVAWAAAAVAAAVLVVALVAVLAVASVAVLAALAAVSAAAVTEARVEAAMAVVTAAVTDIRSTGTAPRAVPLRTPCFVAAAPPGKSRRWRLDPPVERHRPGRDRWRSVTSATYIQIDASRMHPKPAGTKQRQSPHIRFNVRYEGNTTCDQMSPAPQREQPPGC